MTPQSQSCYGIVVLLDFLGVSTFDLKECARFLEIRNNVMNYLEGVQRYLKEETGDFGKNIAPAVEIRTYAFGDNLMIAVKLPHKDQLEQLGVRELTEGFFLGVIAKPIADSFVYCLSKKLLFRGALSVGEFIESQYNKMDVSVIGPAVADVAQWYERANWGGVVMTPKTSHLIDSWQAGYDHPAIVTKKDELLELNRMSIFKYNVPLGEKKMPLWTISWPYILLSLLKPYKKNKKEAEAIINKWISEMSIPLNCEMKYLNIVDFAKTYYQEIKDDSPQLEKEWNRIIIELLNKSGKPQ